MDVLKARKLILKPLQGSNPSILSKWMNTEDYLKLVSSSVNKKYHLRFMIFRRKDNRPIGFLYTFSYNESNGYMFLNIFLDKEYRRVGYGAEACAIAVCYIFDLFPIHKMYCDTLSSNTQSVLMMEGVGLKREGLLRGHILYNGVRYDVVRFAIYRDEILEAIKNLLTRLRRR